MVQAQPCSFEDHPEIIPGFQEVRCPMPSEALVVSGDQSMEELRRELAETRDQQAASAEILAAISSSPTDPRGALERIVASVLRLCDAYDAVIRQLDGDFLRVVAHQGPIDFRPRFPLTREIVAARAFLDRRTIHLADLQAETSEYPGGSDSARRLGFRTIVAVPLISAGAPIGVIALRRIETRLFSDKQIALLETFADQAVIAIENARLFEEVQARNRDLTALGEVGRAVSSTLDLKVVMKTIVDRAVELSGTDGGSIFYLREGIGGFDLGETTGLDEEVIAKFRELDITAGQSGLGEAIASRKPLQMPDITKRPSNALRDAAIEAGLRAALIVPLLSADVPLGALVLQRRKPGEFPEAVVSLMQSFADQSAIALENARLFNEIAQKSRELEIASQHKSQFVANMSHELRTPLAAILGYAELLKEGIYGALTDKSTPIVGRIQSNGTHLLGLINTVLDLSKIEAGQFSLNMGEYALDSMVENVRVATESLAEGKKLALKTDVLMGLPHGLGDEQRLTQVLLNLVGNAIKFTDVGEVRISGAVKGGRFTVAVTDTGPGIPTEEQHKIFEEFHQVDNSNTKRKGGTGLGLAIAKQIVEMHGGRIWVESRPGKGSTFRVELPVRAATTEGAA
jgi:signal transduction histidine kinase